ncbi:PVC-type heme-binding CxxCH protein [Schlesneria paludicola]|uniref:PVC-type heme-binding CxxCH protein n=1 Tax=Schlesneria paludicola TaxID=360056 RepID=UPI00029B2C7B|nr:PVC-type heme-binding CxxCH protein [Schlesneria paludicola]
MRELLRTVCVVGVLLGQAAVVFGQAPKAPLIPHAQDKPPNDPRDPMTAAKMMTVPDGFSVEVVAAEPDIVNPVAMAIDERGRFWITESLEYPRREPGPGQDRIKILEDTNGDGKADKFTVFMEGLNIPSGIAVGHGGVWVANAPDLLFVQDTDGDGKADRQEVVVTGFGRTDTHELPNSLTWGPDGWLYGLNGVFNRSHVHYSKTNRNYQEGHAGWPLTCALFRIHPRTREFQVFCEGTSNPWGVAFNDDGEAFVSACVIDHLWHLIESAYYHRQGGPYPPFTWKMESIVKHKHQKAAYCGIHYFDSDTYPDAYRGKLYMGNIHGGCINVDRVEQHGATYRGFGEPDFLTANDAWFMPVVQKTGPDGSLYVLDWYDRYHCYQDANRDPAGIDRLKGRLYRVRYAETPRVAAGFDLSKQSDTSLIDLLGAKNDFVRDTARRVLQERDSKAIGNELVRRLTGPDAQNVTREHRRRMFITLVSLSVTPSFKQMGWAFTDADPAIRVWALRQFRDDESPSRDLFISHLEEMRWDRSSTREQAQAVITASRSVRTDPERKNASRHEPLVSQLFRLQLGALASAHDDLALSQIVWQNMHPLLEEHGGQFVEILKKEGSNRNVALVSMMPRIVDRLLARKQFDAPAIASVIDLLVDWQPEAAAQSLRQLATKVQNREVADEHLMTLRAALARRLDAILDGPDSSPMHFSAVVMASSWNDPRAVTVARKLILAETSPLDQRQAAMSSLVVANDPGLLQLLLAAFDSPSANLELKSQILASLSRLKDEQVGDVILGRYEKLEPELQTRAIELLTQRAGWAKQLLRLVEENKLASSIINVNQARRLKDLNDDELTTLLTKNWGQVREGRDPDREKYISSMRQRIKTTPGDPFAGERAFKKVCAQCHKIYGEGAEVGPDLTLNGRNDFTQLLSNVFDPSLVIGAGYRSYTVVTNGGRVLNGLLAEDSPQRIVLKVQGGKQEVISRDDIDELKVSEISLMPEQLEKQLTPEEIVDLFTFLSLDKHPSDPSGRKLSGSGEIKPRN